MKIPLIWSRPSSKAPPAPAPPRSFVPDRNLTVPPGQIVRTAYVDIFKVRLACRERMAVGDLDRAFQKVLQSGPGQTWPCPNGHWELGTFVIDDGRHEWLARIMNGYTHVLVAWLE